MRYQHICLPQREVAPAPKIEGLEQRIVEWSHARDCTAEVCYLKDYDPRVGRVEEHWRVKPYILDLVNAMTTSHRGA